LCRSKKKEKSIMIAAKGLLGFYRGVGAELLKRRDRGEMLRLTLEKAGINKEDMMRWKLEESKDWSCLRNGKKEKGERDEQRRVSTGTVRMTLVKKTKRIGKRGI
jgi:protein SDA1